MTAALTALLKIADVGEIVEALGEAGKLDAVEGRLAYLRRAEDEGAEFAREIAIVSGLNGSAVLDEARPVGTPPVFLGAPYAPVVEIRPAFEAGQIVAVWGTVCPVCGEALAEDFDEFGEMTSHNYVDHWTREHAPKAEAATS